MVKFQFAFRRAAAKFVSGIDTNWGTGSPIGSNIDGKDIPRPACHIYRESLAKSLPTVILR